MDDTAWKKDVTVRSYACLRCGHNWLPRIATRPKQCPNCKQPSWWNPTTRVVPRPNKRTRPEIYLDKNEVSTT